MKRVLLTGAGAPGGPGIIKALLKANFILFTSDCNPVASGRFLHQNFVQLPHADNDDFIPFVLKFCIESRIDVVFPLVTKELFKFSLAKQEFAQHNISVIVSGYESLCIANDKGKLYQHLTEKGIAVPRFEIITTAERLVDAAMMLGYPALPVCIKPTLSNGSRGVRILQQGIDEMDLLFNHKPTHIYSTLEKIHAILEQKAFPPLLVSEYLPGPEYTVDTLVQDGEPKLVLPRSRTKMNGGISVQGTFIKNEQIISYCEKIIRSLSLSGPIGLQVKADTNGEFKLLEINPRIQGTSVAALGVGVNLPSLAVQQKFEPVDIDASSIAWGTSFVRYYEEAFYQ
ncbi:MAG TPA: ATP-grasp domain-containing protein [Flavisolibacter sp.]|nr:ATP-grasp domain-containing protein [Flavisolibacter sp.]